MFLYNEMTAHLLLKKEESSVLQLQVAVLFSNKNPNKVWLFSSRYSFTCEKAIQQLIWQKKSTIYDPLYNYPLEVSLLFFKSTTAEESCVKCEL